MKATYSAPLRARGLHALQADDCRAEARHHALHTDPFGVHLDKSSVRVDGAEVMNRVKSERDRFVGFVVEDVMAWDESKRIMGHAKFIDEHTVQVDDHTQIRADRIVIATGSRPVVFPQWQALGDKLIVNDDVFSWDTLPESVAVFGPGVIGLELGQALKRLGVRVEIFGLGGLLGGISDPVVLQEAVEIFGAEMTLHLDAQTETQLTAEGKVQVRWTQEGERGTFTADYLLAATGRRPNVDNLGLENLPIELDARGVPVATRTPCKPASRIFSSRATRPTNCRCCTKPPTKAKSRATTRDVSPTCKQACAAACWAWCSPIRKSQRWARVLPRCKRSMASVLSAMWLSGKCRSATKGAAA